MMTIELQRKIDSMNMSLQDILDQVIGICRSHNVKHVYLFGSYAAGTARPTSDIDIVIKGGENTDALQEEIDMIPTLKKIDLFFYDEIKNQCLKDDIDQYAIELPISPENSKRA
ncbi:MAG: nucleotidyltransferase family protein [Bilifractor sp.]